MKLLKQDHKGEVMKEIQTNTDSMQLAKIVAPILVWYDKNKRVLPWRDSPTAYRVWVSEIMLQQTRVEAVKAYFERFMLELPTIESLAQADEEKLLKLWEGLGYYNRVRNLQKAAQIVMNDYAGKFPETFEKILLLPGIGEYTAGAISSIVFHKPVPAVDGNVMRVVTRLTENYGDITTSAVKRQITEELRLVYPLAKSRCGDLTQSLMELGATVCIPNGAPKCLECPLSDDCRSYQNSTQTELPVKTKKKPRKKEEKTVFILLFEDKVAVKKREESGLLQGLWEFPNGEGKLTTKQINEQLQVFGLSASKITKGIVTKHIFTHVEWHMMSCLVSCENDNDSFLWVTKNELENEVALPTAFKKFSDMIIVSE
ncbi:MAG: A/G-specific adenine glycosylase [Oscillospiraceae bacterium]